jgi:hypothetical protein
MVEPPTSRRKVLWTGVCTYWHLGKFGKITVVKKPTCITAFPLFFFNDTFPFFTLNDVLREVSSVSLLRRLRITYDTGFSLVKRNYHSQSYGRYHPYYNLKIRIANSCSPWEQDFARMLLILFLSVYEIQSGSNILTASELSATLF